MRGVLANQHEGVGYNDALLRPSGKPALVGFLTSNTLGAHPQHPRQRHLRIRPLPDQRLGPARLALRGFSPPYETSHRGVKLPRVCSGLGRFDLRRGADLPQVGRFARTFVGNRVPGPGSTSVRSARMPSSG